VDPSNYQRIRLWAGITSIGTNLALIWGLAFSAAWWASSFAGPLVTATVLLAVATLITLANLPFDLLVGNAVELAASRLREPSTGWMGDWIRHRMLTLAGLWTGMLFFSLFAQIPQPWMPVLLVAAGVLILILLLLVPAGLSSTPSTPEEAFEKDLERELKSLSVNPRPVRWFDHGDSETVNGCITPRGFLSLSTTVAEWLTPREAALMAAREEYYRRSGKWIVILGIVTLWTLLGIFLARFLPSVNAVQAGLNGAAVMSSWCFLALFVWPSVNRVWMRNADEFLAALTSPEEVRDLLSKIERLNATDIELPTAKTAVFHPIPPLQDRISNLD
jgi:hypothetical protein